VAWHWYEQMIWQWLLSLLLLFDKFWNQTSNHTLECHSKLMAELKENVVCFFCCCFFFLRWTCLAVLEFYIAAGERMFIDQSKLVCPSMVLPLTFLCELVLFNTFQVITCMLSNRWSKWKYLWLCWMLPIVFLIGPFNCFCTILYLWFVTMCT
jgi:hypothetical protein